MIPRSRHVLRQHHLPTRPAALEFMVKRGLEGTHLGLNLRGRRGSRLDITKTCAIQIFFRRRVMENIEQGYKRHVAFSNGLFRAMNRAAKPG